MADLSKSISNSIRCFGGSPTTKWGSGMPMVWGTSKWGEGSVSIPLEYMISISNSLVPDSALIFQTQKMITNSMGVSAETTSEVLSKGVWAYVFVSDTTNAENRDTTDWTPESDSTTSFTTVSGGTTNWT